MARTKAKLSVADEYYLKAMSLTDGWDIKDLAKAVGCSKKLVKEYIENLNNGLVNEEPPKVTEQFEKAAEIEAATPITTVKQPVSDVYKCRPEDDSGHRVANLYGRKTVGQKSGVTIMTEAASAVSDKV